VEREEIMLYAMLVLAALFCGARAIGSARLQTSAIWLAGASAFTALLLYLLGAALLAVIELSVGAGLVTVLVVLAISISGEDAFVARSVVPKPLALLLVLAALVALAWLAAPPAPPSNAPDASFPNLLWSERGLDVLAQLVLIFAGVLGVVHLIGQARASVQESKAIVTEETYV
jgi:NADH:ubiquinone oxidoreductase subunit 6 (subunit J)